MPSNQTRSAPLLEVCDVSVRLSGRDVLKEISFNLNPGEFAGLIGSNGAGKTTIFRVVLGFLQPTSGEVRVNGERRSRRNALIGYVPQKIAFDPDLPLRARDVVGLGIEGAHVGFARLQKRERANIVDAMLEAVEAQHFADTRIGRLSGGEQQRILIAHALAANPKILILDEPFANLDIASEQGVIEVLHRIVKDQRIGVLLSTHDMNPLLSVMDRVVYLAGGRSASGSVEEIVRPEVLTRLYGHHVDVVRIHDRVIVVAGANPGAATPVPLHEHSGTGEKSVLDH